jgi:hypothetical protein
MLESFQIGCPVMLLEQKLKNLEKPHVRQADGIKILVVIGADQISCFVDEAY